MKLYTPLRHALMIVSLWLALLPVAMAQGMVSVNAGVVNMRNGPSIRSEALWQLTRGYPLKVIKRQGKWVQVRDFENDTGWVARSLVSTRPHHIVKSKVANIRKGPATRYARVGSADYGEVLRTLAKRGGWIQVRRENGQVGWVSRKLVWGW